MVDLLKLFSTPIVLILTLLACGFILPRDSRRGPRGGHAGYRLSITGITIFYLLSLGPVSNLLVYSLESRYAPAPECVLSDLDVVVILGGGFMSSGGFREYPEASGPTYSRLFNGVEMFKKSGARKLVLSGGCFKPGVENEAAVMKDLALRLAVPGRAIAVETRSRTTMEQAAGTAELLSAGKKRKIGLVTSAMHMPRSEKAFKKKFAEDFIIPLPVNYLSRRPDLNFTIRSFIPSAENFCVSSWALHEFIGMVWYILRGAA